MFNGFICKYCGKKRRWEERDYDVGLYLAQIASFEALGHIEGVTPYLICNKCSKEIEDDC